MSGIRTFLAAVQFLTTLPVSTAFTSDEIGRSAPWFPVVGLAVGGLVAIADLAARNVGLPWSVRTVLAVAMLAVLSGGLHLDGLADTADGFFSSRTPDRILEIMRDSRIGSMGVLALALVLGLKAAAIAELAQGGARTGALLLAPVFGRALQVAGLTWMPYARPEGGLASVFLPHRSIYFGIISCAIPALSAGLVFGRTFALALAAAVSLLVAWWARACRNTIGGMTGDTLGALSELGEALVLVVFAWNLPDGGRCG
ncbi:MAG TPA: adenosylcobinamide-GDP ribazoletransferase [Candidatus Ozemobacteraceae bacterium]|nr:adenosylcobinamide-GDP ribazoletransferase [Candidatus Ozemobacteraceae bacterium]HQG27860.1 adenosylcobinamide-GDP ribazoletransferase [Candidatus Ozemobacteraceae bacterium]